MHRDYFDTTWKWFTESKRVREGIMPASAPCSGASAFVRSRVAGEGWWEVLVTLQLLTSSFV